MPPAEAAFSPLDEELELGSETFDPWLVESIVLLGTVAPFERVPLVLDRLLGVPVSADTARRLTERIGRTQAQREDAEAERVRATLPLPTTGPAVQQLSLDGAMVPLVGGAWAEVKTLALGEVEQTTAADGGVQIQTTALSYFSRLTDAETFRELARGELYRRGTAAATVVCAVQDGAEWQQRFVDHHRPDAVRIRDFPHAVEHLGTAGRAVFGAGTAAFSAWLGVQAHTFKHGDPEAVLTALRTLDLTAAVDPEAARHQMEALAYFEKRRTQITDADFRAMGYPIGSGAVERANKLVPSCVGASWPGSRAVVCAGTVPRSRRWSASAISCVATAGSPSGLLSGGLTWPRHATAAPGAPSPPRRMRQLHQPHRR